MPWLHLTQAVDHRSLLVDILFSKYLKTGSKISNDIDDIKSILMIRTLRLIDIRCFKIVFDNQIILVLQHFPHLTCPPTPTFAASVKAISARYTLVSLLGKMSAGGVSSTELSAAEVVFVHCQWAKCQLGEMTVGNCHLGKSWRSISWGISIWVSVSW
jgi:hypothetical protein